jgi:glycerol-3-phosphate acyltransferase PlsY
MDYTIAMAAVGISLAVGYAMGSLPFGYWLGKARGVNLLEVGSGSTGATNALRNLGKTAGAMVLLADFGKGLLAPVVAAWLWVNWVGDSELLLCRLSQVPAMAQVLAAAAVLVGHSKSIWIGFRGGKSVAAGVGTLFAIDWRVGAIVAGIWALVVWLSRYSSLGALIAVPSSVLLMPAFRIYDGMPPCGLYDAVWATGYCLVGAAYIVWRHRSNISRLRRGQEPKLSGTGTGSDNA